MQLALHRAVGLEEQVLGQLLGEGRAALDDPARAEIGGHGPDETDRVDAEMVAEPPVLGGDDRLGQVVGQFVDPDLVALEGAAMGEHLAIGRKNRNAAVALGEGQVFRARHGGPDIGAERAEGDHAP